MIKTYRLAESIKAEQLVDGQSSPTDVHEGYIWGSGPNPYVVDTPKGSAMVGFNEWVLTDEDGDHWVLSNSDFKKKCVELPVIPKYVDSYIKHMKAKGSSMLMAFIDGEYDKSGEWISNHAESFGRAWLDGYQVEEEFK